MQIGSGTHVYEWIEPWAELPETESVRTGWAHPGVAVTAGGEVLTFHPGEPEFLVFDPDGRLRRTFRPDPSDIGDAHGMCLVQEDGVEYLWVADNGAKRPTRPGYQGAPGTPPRGQFLKLTLHGRVLASLEVPGLPVYREGGKFSPTSVCVAEERFGCNGDVWVADGYGQSLVHRYSKDGEYRQTIGGDGPAGPMKTPHAVFVDTRRREPELYVADRSNRRVVVYDLDGGFKRAFGEDVFSSPSGFAVDPTTGHLVVAELRARLAVLDEPDRLVCYLGENEAVCATPGWPNSKDDEGKAVRARALEPGKFNSPHGMNVDAQGNIYVAEWLIGGRYLKLEKRG